LIPIFVPKLPDNLTSYLTKDVDDDDDEPNNCVANFDTGMEGMHVVMNEIVTNTIALSFRYDYAKSVKPMMEKVDSLFARLMWCGLPIARHPP
jgi:hypothetical protein